MIPQPLLPPSTFTFWGKPPCFFDCQTGWSATACVCAQPLCCPLLGPSVLLLPQGAGESAKLIYDSVKQKAGMGPSSANEDLKQGEYQCRRLDVDAIAEASRLSRELWQTGVSVSSCCSVSRAVFPDACPSYMPVSWLQTSHERRMTSHCDVYTYLRA
jgi:hypothetical protein